MGIRMNQSFSGYVASEPNTEPTEDGTPKFYARGGQRQGRREPDGSYTPLPTEYMPIVAFGEAAEEAAAQLRKGSNFTADGRVRTVTFVRDGKTVEREEFEVWKIGRRPSRTELAATIEHGIDTAAVAESSPEPARSQRESRSRFGTATSSRQRATTLAM